MKKYVIFSILGLAFCMLQAIPIGNLGNIRVPNAYVMPGNMVNLSFGSYFAANDWRSPTANNSTSANYQYNCDGTINVGIMNRGEIGFVAAKYGVYCGNVKLKILEETVRLPAITLGVDNILSTVPADVKGVIWNHIMEPSMYERNSIYGAVTKSSVVRGLGFINYLETIITIGAGNNRFRGQNELSHKINGVFLAFELKPTPAWSVITEMDGYNLNAGVKGTYKNFSGQLSMTELEQFQSLRFGVNVGYTFDKYVTTRRPNVLFGLEGGQQEFAGRRTVTKPEEIKQGNELLDELKLIRSKREQAEKELGEIKKILQEQQ